MRYLNAPNTAFGEDRRSYKTGTNGVTSNQTVFNVSYDNGMVEAYLNGVRLYPGDDYTKSSSGIGTSITLASAIGANNVLEVVGYQGINSGNALVEDNFVVGTSSTGSGGSYGGSTTVFNVASSAGDTVSVWRNGVKLVPTTDYTVQASASTVTLASPGASSADEITVQVVGGVIHNNGLTVNSGSNSFFLPTTRGTDAYVLTRDDSLGDGGTTWKETVTPPSITSVTTPASDNSINEDTNVTMTINGTNFSNSMSVSLVDASSGATVTGHGNLGIASFVSSSQLTVNTDASTSSISNSNVKVKVDKSGLTATSTSISVSPDPAFSAPSSNNTTLASILDTTAGNVEVVGSSGIVASASDSAAITYALTGGTTNGDWQFNTTTGVVTSPSSGVDSASNTYTEAFTVTATAGGDSSRTDSRTFNIIVSKAPIGGTIIEPGSYTGGGYRSHTFFYAGNSQSTNTFTLYVATTIDVLLVGGGGGVYFADRSGGGGAGAFVPLSSQSWPAGDYTMTVGVGGSNTNTQANNDGGETSITYSGSGSFTTLIAKGGASGGEQNGSSSLDETGKFGGSGGGTGWQGSPGTGGTYGNNGSDQSSGSGNDINGGGGGGAGGNAVDATSSQGGTGGAGATNYWRDGDTSGTTAGTHVFAGGGGGGAYNNNGGTGGKVGTTILGGDGGSNGVPSGQGVDGTGSGGGGGGGTSHIISRGGGHGVIILRYAV